MPRITLTDEEIHILAHLTRHFTDYMFKDDRPDHGLGVLKDYRDQNKEPRPRHVENMLSAMVKLNRASKRLQKEKIKKIMKLDEKDELYNK